MRILLLVPIFLLSLPLAAQQDSSYRTWLRFTFEDDYLKPFWRNKGSIDRYYTSGLKLEYYNSDLRRQWIEKWMPYSSQYTTKSVSYAVGCNMYTPAKLYQPNVDSNDRPYAGWLYVSARGTYNNTYGHPHRITVDYSAGVLGPPSLQEQLQKSFHHFINSEIHSTIPQGWGNQIGAALALNANGRYESSLWHSRHPDSMVLLQKATFETFPFLEVNAGSVMDYLRAGWVFNFQTGGQPSYFQKQTTYNTVYPNLLVLPAGNLHPALSSRTARQKFLTVEFYASPSVTLVGYNATLSGGLIPFQHSPYVLTADRVKRLYGEVDAALMLQIKWLGLLYTCTYRTVEFKGQGALPSFWGAISILVLLKDHH